MDVIGSIISSKNVKIDVLMLFRSTTWEDQRRKWSKRGNIISKIKRMILFGTVSTSVQESNQAVKKIATI